MFAVGFQMIFFVYLISTCMMVAEELWMKPYGVQAVNLQGQPVSFSMFYDDNQDTFEDLSADVINPSVNGTTINRLTDAVTAGYDAVWTMIGFLVSPYMFSVFELIGLPPIVRQVVSGIWILVVVVTLISYIFGRRTD